MHDLKMKVQTICDMEEKLAGWMKSELEKGPGCVNTEEAGQVIDMIKDLCDAEKNLYKACYYKTVIKAMDEYDPEEDEDEEMGIGERRGYDNWRYMSSGRYAPKGHGTRTGRRGYVDPQMGYDVNPDRMSGETEWMMHDSRYGKPYQDYMKARRHYTETHDEHDRDTMENKAVEHMSDMIATMKEIWNDATPALRKQMANDLKGLTSGMVM